MPGLKGTTTSRQDQEGTTREDQPAQGGQGQEETKGTEEEGTKEGTSGTRDLKEATRHRTRGTTTHTPRLAQEDLRVVQVAQVAQEAHHLPRVVQEDRGPGTTTTRRTLTRT